ncbi:MAG: glycosyltransferase [Methylotenera sp.]|nr:glycosyltransferase [Methylotenera sp.]
MVKAHLFWAYGKLTKLEQLSIVSFVKQGYEVNLWTYGDMPNAPKGVLVKDAREILDESEVFLNQRGSYAGFSDLFRYAVLSSLGGLYADTDVIALKPASDLPKEAFLVTERAGTKINLKNLLRRVFGLQKADRINGNIIYNPNPANGNLIDLAYAYSLRFPKKDVKWSEIGPSLLTAIVKIYPEHGFAIQNPDFANPISYSFCPKKLLETNVNIPDSSFFLHCYNEKWRRAGKDKNQDYPVNSLLYKLEKKFLI